MITAFTFMGAMLLLALGFEVADAKDDEFFDQD